MKPANEFLPVLSMFGETFTATFRKRTPLSSKPAKPAPGFVISFLLTSINRLLERAKPCVSSGKTLAWRVSTSKPGGCSSKSFSLFSISTFLRGGNGIAWRYQYAARCCEPFHNHPDLIFHQVPPAVAEPQPFLRRGILLHAAVASRRNGGSPHWASNGSPSCPVVLHETQAFTGNQVGFGSGFTRYGRCPACHRSSRAMSCYE